MGSQMSPGEGGSYTAAKRTRSRQELQNLLNAGFLQISGFDLFCLFACFVFPFLGKRNKTDSSQVLGVQVILGSALGPLFLEVTNRGRSERL